MVEGSKVVVTVSLGPTPKVVYMENLQDLVLTRAEGFLKSLDMNLNIKVEQEYSDTIVEGNVTRTDPEKDVQLTAGQDITVWVSMGPEIKTGAMPGVVAESQENAKKILNNQGLDLRVTTEEIYDSLIPVGHVVRTDPEKGTQLQTGQAVKLYISQGPETAKMPNCVGLDIEKAMNILIAAGFKTPTIEYTASNEPKGVVVSQSEEKNTQVDVSKDIVLILSEGKVEATIDVVIDLQGSANETACNVVVKRQGVVVFAQDVPVGTVNITVPAQTGSGSEQYEVIINDDYGWNEMVTFTTDG